MSMSNKSTVYKRAMLLIASYLPQRFRPIFLHPAGPTTIFFWAPTFKWGLVIANVGDINRPVETISLSQTASLMLTSAIWSSVNAFTCATSKYLFARALLHRMEQKKQK